LSGSVEDRPRVILLTLRARADEAQDARALELLERDSGGQPRFGVELVGLESLLRSVMHSRLDSTRESRRASEQLAMARTQVQQLEARLRKERNQARSLGARFHEAEEKTDALETRLRQEQKKAAALR
jgi:chromosome segregation ATPase